MKFSINYNSAYQANLLKYQLDEYSFSMENLSKEVNYDLVLNKLNLVINDDKNQISGIWGYCGYLEWKKSLN